MCADLDWRLPLEDNPAKVFSRSVTCKNLHPWNSLITFIIRAALTMDPPTEVVHRVPVAGGTGMWAPENAYLDPAGDVYLLMRSVKLRVSSETLSQYSGTFAKLFGHDNTITPAAHREMVEKVDLHGKELSRTGPPTIHLHEDITWPLVRLCKLAHGQTFVERALPETASPEKCEQYAQEVYELVLAAINYEFRIILPQISKMARQRLKIYADRRPSVSSLARFVSVAYAIEDARLFREATSCMVQVTSGQSLRNALPKSLNQLVPTAHVVGLWGKSCHNQSPRCHSGLELGNLFLIALTLLGFRSETFNCAITNAHATYTLLAQRLLTNTTHHCHPMIDETDSCQTCSMSEGRIEGA